MANLAREPDSEITRREAAKAAASGHQEGMRGASGVLAFPAASPADSPPPAPWTRPPYLPENVLPRSFIRRLVSYFLSLQVLSHLGEAHGGPGFASV